MPRQNRSAPDATLHAVPSKGLFMGNRGVLHNDQQQIVKHHTTQGWVICSLNHKGIQRQIMTPGRYTELFFLDEATALAAGHRPCNDCLKEKCHTFKRFWLEANQSVYPNIKTLADINRVLHKERYQNRQKVVSHLTGDQLPNGCMVKKEEGFYLIYEQQLVRWHFEGYGAKTPRVSDETYSVLTPISIVRTLTAGYQPDYHPSLSC